MKKTVLVFSLCLALILVGCGGSTNSNLCRFGGAPNAFYGVTYPDSFSITGFTNQFGDLWVSKRGYTCNQLTVRVGTNSFYTLTASPASVYLPSPPATGTISGQGFDTTYGMPSVNYFDSNGYLIGTAYANSVSSGGTSLQANLPNLSYVYSGTYQVKVTNKTYDGLYLNIVGSATMTGWGRDRPDSDGDGWYDDEDCAPYDPSFNYDCSETCGGYGNVPRHLCNDEPF